MVAKRVTPSESSKARRPPAKTPEDREKQLVGIAVDLAEKQMREGTASAQVITHFLKIASGGERLAREKVELENELLKAKIKSIGSAEEVQVMYKDALDAMRAYSGQEVEDYDED